MSFKKRHIKVKEVGVPETDHLCVQSQL